MNLRRRLSVVVALGSLIIIGAGATLLALDLRAPVPVTGALIGVIAVASVAAVVVSWRALHTSAVPLERVADRAARQKPGLRPGLLTGPVDPQVRVLALALEDAAAALASRQEELERTRVSFRQALTRLGEVLASTHDREGILEAMVEVALLVVPGDAAVYYRPVGATAIEATHARGVGITGLRLDRTGLAGAAAVSGRVAVIGAGGAPGVVVVAPDQLDRMEPDAVAGVAAPMQLGGRLIGVVAIYGTTVGRPFDDDEVGLLVSLLRQAEVAINNVELHEQARREALTDGVTGLWNRRQFDIRLREAIAASQRFGEPFGVAMFDLDDFKRINDNWDHLTGDAALVHFSALLRGATRDVDVVSRWGGEEFVVLLPRTAIDDVAMVAQRIVDLTRASPLTKGDEQIAFTVSAGIAGYPADGTTAHEIVAAADAALLEAKARGKDRLHRASCTGQPRPGADQPRTEESPR